MERLNHADQHKLNQSIEKLKAYNGIAQYKKLIECPIRPQKGGFQAQKRN